MSRAGTVLVTGGAGFIGSALVEHLVACGRRVIAIDNLVNGKRENLAHLPADRVRLAAADVRRPNEFAATLREAGTVFHLACLGVRHSLHAPRENRDVNEGGTIAMLEAARTAAVAAFVHVSSSEVYGASGTGALAEDAPTRPTNPYAEAKLAAEAHARAAHAAGGMRVVILRPFNAYGPRCHHEGDAGEVIPKFLLRALAGRPLTIFGDGGQTRDFTWVEDTAAGIAAAEAAPGAAGQTINLGSGRAVAINALAALAARAAGRPVEIAHAGPRPGDTPHLEADTGRALRLLGWQAATPLEEGLARLASWYRGQATPPERLLSEEIEQNWRPEALAAGRKSPNSRSA